MPAKHLASPLRYPFRNSTSHNAAIIDQAISIPLAVREDQRRWEEANRRKPYPDYRKKAAEEAARQVRGNLSALFLLPGFDQFTAAAFDPMHLLLEGCTKTYFHKVLVLGDHGATQDIGEEGMSSGGSSLLSEEGGDLVIATAEKMLDEHRHGASVPRAEGEYRSILTYLKSLKSRPRTARKRRFGLDEILFLQSLLRRVVTPISISPLHRSFGTPAAGTPTASDWRVFATVFGPLTIPLTFLEKGNIVKSGNTALNRSELQALMSLFEIVALALRSSISDTQLQRMDVLIARWQSLVYSLHPSLKRATNLHALRHLPDDIRHFGPVYNWWSFPSERVNYIVKSTNSSGASQKEAEVVSYKAVLRARDVESVRTRTLQRARTGSRLQQTAADEVEGIFASFGSGKATTSLEHAAFRYWEGDRSLLRNVSQYSAGRSPVKLRGRSRDRTLDPYTANKLKDCLSAWGIAGTTTQTVNQAHRPVPFIRSLVTFWEGMEYGASRFDAAEWSTMLHPILNSTASDSLVTARSSTNSFFEIIQVHKIYSAQDSRSAAAILCGIFEHSMTRGAGEPDLIQLYGVVRKFRSYEGEDHYRYSDLSVLSIVVPQHES